MALPRLDSVWKIGLGVFNYGITRNSYIDLTSIPTYTTSVDSDLVFRFGDNASTAIDNYISYSKISLEIEINGTTYILDISPDKPSTSFKEVYGESIPANSTIIWRSLTVINGSAKDSTSQQDVPANPDDRKDALEIVINDANTNEAQYGIRIDTVLSCNLLTGDGVEFTYTKEVEVGVEVNECYTYVNVYLPASRELTAYVSWEYTQGAPDMFDIGPTLKIVQLDDLDQVIDTETIDLTSNSGESYPFTILVNCVKIEYWINFRGSQTGTVKIDVKTWIEQPYVGE